MPEGLRKDSEVLGRVRVRTNYVCCPLENFYLSAGILVDATDVVQVLPKESRSVEHNALIAAEAVCTHVWKRVCNFSATSQPS